MHGAAVVSFSEGAIQIMALAWNVFQKVSSVNKNEFPPVSSGIERGSASLRVGGEKGSSTLVAADVRRRISPILGTRPPRHLGGYHF